MKRSLTILAALVCALLVAGCVEEIPSGTITSREHIKARRHWHSGTGKYDHGHWHRHPERWEITFKGTDSEGKTVENTVRVSEAEYDKARRGKHYDRQHGVDSR
jgi:hypothetical protein